MSTSRKKKATAVASSPRKRAEGAAALASLRVRHQVFDERVESFSILVSMSVADYLSLTEPAYQRRGSIEGQRDALKTSTAIRIRDRMAEDLKAGAVLPPVVVGILLDPEVFETDHTEWSDERIRAMLSSTADDAISIIDGMQRTTVLIEQKQHLKARELRVELWLTQKTTNLTYRMLVLNTGQVPWNLRRQIEVINRSLISEIRRGLSVPKRDAPEIYGIDEGSRRTNPGEYQANDVVEMYLAFGLRKAQVDKESTLVDQFSRLDMIDAVSQRAFLSNFIEIFRRLIKFDRVFGMYPGTKTHQRFSSGRAIFDSQPACVGFMAAAAQKIYGRPGVAKEEAVQRRALNELLRQCDYLIQRLGRSPSRIGQFLDLNTLNEVLEKPVGKIGDAERSSFTDAFRLLFEDGAQLDSMTPCWRAQ